MPGLGQPRFFLDRSLNAKSIAEALRAGGFDAETMDERYGPIQAQTVHDPVWIRDATLDGLVLLHKDKSIRRRPIEKAALMEYDARSFALANGQLPGPVMVTRFLNNLDRILAAVQRRPGPYFYHVHGDRIESMPLR